VRCGWDPEKAAANVRKHRVGFHEAATVLDEPLSTTLPDVAPSEGEMRVLTIGASAKGADGTLEPAARA
jgi:uncharacterized DUF497 family protein